MRDIREIIRLGGGPDLVCLFDCGQHTADSARPAVPHLLEADDPVIRQIGALLQSAILAWDDQVARSAGIPGPALQQADAAYRAYLAQER